jgi:DNA-directed RNA polymerase subunit RPC12/RpoP
MALELIQCPYCGYKFRTDIKVLENEGKTTVVRGFFDFLKPKTEAKETVDIVCLNCKKIFEQEVKS